MNLRDLRLTNDPLPGTSGIAVLHAFDSEYAAPIAFFWYRNILVGQTEILFMFTNDYFRRKGVATYLFRQLVINYPTTIFCTAVGNDFSKPWLIKNRFEATPQGWFFKGKPNENKT